MKQAETRKRNRVIALAFVSILLLLMYGPLAQWFVTADRVLYDQLAGGRPAAALDNGYIVSIDSQRKSADELLVDYGQLSDQQVSWDEVELVNPVHDYIKPEHISLYVTNVGSFQPSFIYRLLAEYYHSDDWESFE